MKKLLTVFLLVLALCTFSVQSNAYCGYSRCWYRPRYVVRVHHYRTHHYRHSCRYRRYRHFRRY